MVERRLIQINGIVQGVGFRPFVYNSAIEFNLCGFVKNSAHGVEIEVEGPTDVIGQFTEQIEVGAPPLSVIREVKQKPIPRRDDGAFTIETTEKSSQVSTLISPDMAVCGDCLTEMFDPEDRRYRYPFINCTNCGPRYTIIQEIPYDRASTTMEEFTMCQACQAEYDDPLDRRFHAQPNACHLCGPEVNLLESNGQLVETEEPIRKTAQLLKEGRIVSIKGLGGFHLAVDALNEEAVALLRERKSREEKPFALMVKNLMIAQKLCRVNEEEAAALTSQRSPILLLLRSDDSTVAQSVAPGSRHLGIMLPYTPLHHLLLDEGLEALVMTSANHREEPICIDNDDAMKRLGGVGDYFLVHNRDIHLRSDDSVAIHLKGKRRQIRRSRGFAPSPVFVNSDGPPILALGGELKNTVCLLKGENAFLSQYIGDLENLEVYDFFQLTIDHLQKILDIKPVMLVHDLHPGYFSTQWAKKQEGIEIFGVQHHHAHMAACMAENSLSDPVIGLIMDGTGFGEDGTIWGGEVLVGDYRGYRRFGRFDEMPLPGGDGAIKAPWKTAVSYLYKAFEGELPELPFLKDHDFEPIVEIVEKNVHCPLTTSCGRLFDAVAAMCGGRQTISYEGQAAIEFMHAAKFDITDKFDYAIREDDGVKVMSLAPIIRSVAAAVLAGESMSQISGRFHSTLVNMFSDIAAMAKEETGLNQVVLSGGVFQNHLLFEALITKLERIGFDVYSHSQVPANDGGLSLGQAVIGRHHLRKESLCA